MDEEAQRLDEEVQRRARAQKRATWPIRVYRLGEEPIRDPLDRSSVDECLRQMWSLACAAWSVSGRTIPHYERGEAPGSIIRDRQLPCTQRADKP